MRFVTDKLNLNREQAEELLLRKRDRISLDIETVSLENPLPLGVAVGLSRDLGYYFFDPGDALLHKLIEQTPTVLMHNASFDAPILKRLGHCYSNFEDTMLVAYSQGLLENSLEALSWSVLRKEFPSVTSQWKKKDQGNIGIDHVKMAGMSIIHAENTYALWDKLVKVPLYYEIDKPCINLVIEMEQNGLLVDQFKLTEVEQETVVKTNELERELREELFGINLNSNPQIVEALQAKGIMGTRKTKAGKDSVSDESLRPLNHPLTNKLLEYRSLMKTVSTYVPAFRSVNHDGRIHTHFGYTNTGRWRSSRPNLQNITNNDLRKCIIAPPGCRFLSQDASQIELRVVGILSQDPLLLQALASEDLHLATAIQVFGWADDAEEMKRRRYLAKQLNFAILYGADEFKVAEMAGVSVIEAGNLIQSYFQKYNVLHQWILQKQREAEENGFVINFFDRIRPIPELSSGSWKIREKGKRESVNTIVQGTAVDIVKKMMLYLRTIYPEDIRLVLQVHDEILWEVPDELMPLAIEGGRELAYAFPDYPVNTKVGRVYGDLEELIEEEEIR